MKWQKLACAVVILACAPAVAATPAKTRKERPKPARVVAIPAADVGLSITTTEPSPIPERWHDALGKGLPVGQRLVQTLVGDLDGDGKPEWIAVGEPTQRAAKGVSLAIFRPAAGEKPPELRFAQLLQEPSLRVAGAQVMEVRPLGQAVVLVGAEPNRAGDSRFVVEIYAWNGEAFRPMVPQIAEFRSQGGFSIEPGEPPYQGDELVVWTYRLGEDEQLYDWHFYEFKRWRWDGVRFKSETLETVTPEKLPDPDAARRAARAKKPDLRRQMPRVAEVP
ncbi:MAG TPA: hypothetical protein VN033_13110 [Vulgatibacter sp.]|nr:hypothetical protein [Vulgatibacter sp.]